MRKQIATSQLFLLKPRAVRIPGLLCLGALFAIPLGVAQQGMNSSGNITHNYAGPPMHVAANPLPDANKFMESTFEAQAARKHFDQLNLKRQKEMASDTAKLVALASHLSSEAGPGAKETISMNSVREAEEIEKLAHSVREKMKSTIGD